MAVNVRVSGPELLNEENRRAFLRIEESLRQYSAHTRESIYLVRRPLGHAEDHIVLLWSHGIALLELVPVSGVIRGAKQGFWRSEKVTENAAASNFLPPHSRHEPHAEVIPNSYDSLRVMQQELEELLQRDLPDSMGNGTIPIALLAVFPAARSVQIEPIDAPLFFAQTLEDALARSIMHRPNLLRRSEIPDAQYSNDLLARMAGALEASAERWKQAPRAATQQPKTPVTIPSARSQTKKQHSPYWLILVLLVLMAFTYVMIRVVLIRSSSSTKAPATQVIQHPPSEIIIHTPLDVELFISPFEFPTREQFDHALTYGEGMRFLPDTEQIVVMDSLSLAKGVYGYFNVEDQWRKGMLLQTLSHSDTIDVVKFLDPLP